MKKKIIEVVGNSGLPTVKNIRATGNNVLVERLNKQDLVNSTIWIGEGNGDGPPQGYVLDVGPLVSKECGFKVGDRVLMSGAYTPCPKIDDNPRERGLLLPDMIKAVLEE